MNNRTVLLVSYHFPPIGGSGVQRALKLARYLPDHGWDVHVLCADHQRYPLLDESLVGEIDPRVLVHRVAGLEPASLAGRLSPRGRSTLQDRLAWRLERLVKWLPLSEPELLWLPDATARAASLMAQFQYDAVITTSPPHAAHLVGDLLHGNFGVPWVADLRDPITDNFAYDATGLAHRIFRLIERRVASATEIVATCPEFAECIEGRYPAAAGRVSVVTNGYDSADAPSVTDRCRGDVFTLGYVGAFYRQQSIAPVLAAIRELRAWSSDFAKAFRFRLVGSVAASQRSLIHDRDREYFLEAGYLPHHNAIEEMARADALLLLTPANDGGRLCIPAKTFEYLAFGRHVIAGVHLGSQLAKILERAGNSRITTPTEAGLARAIRETFAAWRTGELQTQRDMGYVARFTREKLAGEYAGILDGVVNKNPSNRQMERELVA
jgi:glycosyltransferase involved in cell wall biosynthesis